MEKQYTFEVKQTNKARGVVFAESKEEAKEIYEKALDKACEQLESLSYENNMMKASPYAYDCDYTNEEEWKEWCMKDVD